MRHRGAGALRGQSGLAAEALEHVWRLADLDADGAATPDEFVLAMHLCNWIVKTGAPAPERLPPALVPSAWAPLAS